MTAALFLFAVSLPAHPGRAEEELSSVAKFEHDLISGTHQEILQKIHQPITDLDTKYQAALEKRRADAQAAGKLDQVVEIDAAIKSFANGIPPNGESADPELAKLGKVYVEQRTKLESSFKPALVDAWNLHRRKLDGLVTRLTKEGKIEDAKLVRAEATRIDDTIAELSGKVVIKSARDLILSTTWEMRGAGEGPRRVRFRDDGIATLVGKTATLWKWRIENEKVLWCHWVSTGWVKFEIADLQASKFEGVSKGGQKWTMSPAD